MNIKIEPLVSIIVPVYNVENYIDACLDSITQQTYKNLEIIVVEDCSTDNSRQVLDSHLTDKRIRVIQHSENGGLSAARNTGIDSATGEYMMFIDSDDIVDTRLVAACVDCAFKNNAEVVTYGFAPFKDGLAQVELPYPSNGLEFKASALHNAYFDLPHFAWLKFILSSTVRSASLKFPVGLYYEDWPFHWHLGLSTKFRYQLLADLYLYRQRSSSITGSTGKELLDLFIIHSKVNSLLQQYQNDEINKIFAYKVRKSHWSILTRIDSGYLADAIKKAREAEKEFGLYGYKSKNDLRGLIISKIINAPEPAAFYSLKLLRAMLNKRSKIRAK
ncbi:glycosyltransferase family 2 protein [uncultured Psychrobacter sp.]|uniref:glycosyltransferase family 2 protein n=1 Tax=uncultured Psychrobacter sp. TaxID=259303 RepID=UPI00260A4159|nr:glycosyltransferase family 2 protein [uncultured Psychrobacter sp.]